MNNVKDYFELITGLIVQSLLLGVNLFLFMSGSFFSIFPAIFCGFVSLFFLKRFW